MLETVYLVEEAIEKFHSKTCPGLWFWAITSPRIWGTEPPRAAAATWGAVCHQDITGGNHLLFCWTLWNALSRQGWCWSSSGIPWRGQRGGSRVHCLAVAPQCSPMVRHPEPKVSPRVPTIHPLFWHICSPPLIVVEPEEYKNGYIRLAGGRDAAPSSPNCLIEHSLAFICNASCSLQNVAADTAPSCHERQQVSCSHHNRERPASLTLSSALVRGQLRVRGEDEAPGGKSPEALQAATSRSASSLP